MAAAAASTRASRLGLRGSHQRAATVLHNVTHIGKIKVDQAFAQNEIVIAAQRRATGPCPPSSKHFQTCLPASAMRSRFLVGNDDDGVGRIEQVGKAILGSAHAARASK